MWLRGAGSWTLLMLSFVMATPCLAESSDNEVSDQKIDALIENLGAKQVTVRDEAVKQLMQIGQKARPRLEAALKQCEDYQRQRIELVLRNFDAQAHLAEQTQKETLYREFMAGKEGASLPGWPDFRERMGDKCPKGWNRAIFGAMYRAEPELLDAYQCNRDIVPKLLDDRIHWYDAISQLKNQAKGAKAYVPLAVRYKIAEQKPASVLAYIFVAGNPEIELLSTTEEELLLISESEFLTLVDTTLKDIAKVGRFALGKAWSVKLQYVRSRISIGWLRRSAIADTVNAGVAKRILIRQVIASVLGDIKDEVPFFVSKLNEPWDWELHPHLLAAISYLGDTSQMHVLELFLDEQHSKSFGKDPGKKNARDFARSNDWKEYLEQRPEVHVQARDLALLALVELTSQQAEDYGFTPTQYGQSLKDSKFPAQRLGIGSARQRYYFSTAEQRERAIAKWHAWEKTNRQSAKAAINEAN